MNRTYEDGIKEGFELAAFYFLSSIPMDRAKILSKEIGADLYAEYKRDEAEADKYTGN